MTLRVLHVIPAVAVRYGGPSAAVTGMCRALRARGVDANIVTTDADGPHRLAVALDEWIDRDGVPTRFFRRYAGEALKLTPGLSRWAYEHAGEFDVVHAHAVFSHAPVAAAQACRRARVPLIVRPLGTLDPWSIAQKPLRKRLAWHAGVGRMLRGAAAIHYTSSGERRRVEGSLGLTRGVVIPLGVDPSLEPLSRAGRAGPLIKPYVLALGRLHPKKNLEGLIEAFVAARLGDVRLVLAGDGDPAYVAELRRRAGGLAGERIVFAGWLQGERKATVIGQAAALAMPSFQENFGLSAAEGMALGVPVVLARTVDLAEDVAKAGAGWVTDDGPGALAKALQAVFEDEQERCARGARARDLVAAKFTWDRVGEALEALYRSLVR